VVKGLNQEKVRRNYQDKRRRTSRVSWSGEEGFANKPKSREQKIKSFHRSGGGT